LVLPRAHDEELERDRGRRVIQLGQRGAVGAQVVYWRVGAERDTAALVEVQQHPRLHVEDLGSQLVIVSLDAAKVRVGAGVGAGVGVGVGFSTSSVV